MKDFQFKALCYNSIKCIIGISQSIEKVCILTGKADIQTVLRMLLVIVGFSRAPVGVRKHRSITPQPLSILKREERE